MRKWLFTPILFFAFVLSAQQTSLDRYVQAPDSHYKYELVRAIPGSGYTAYVLDMTSQSWRKPSEVDQPVWKHWITIVKPDKVDSPTGLLYIDGGSNDGKPPARADTMMVSIALSTNSVTANLRMIPNQPLVFGNDGKPRKEDDLIAYTWDKYLRTGDDTWPARLPMTKAAVRAMDTITAFCAGLESGAVKIDKFVVSGGSKRGWTAWTTAAVDKRVVAVAPLVIDLLNIQPSFQHHWRAYGFWAPSVNDYVKAGIMDRFWTPQAEALMKIVEPYSYRDRLTMPKMIVNAAGDQFFLPDSWQFYWNDLKGEKNLRYVPNADHSLRGSDAPFTLAAFLDSIVHNRPRPRLDWKIGDDGAIRVTSLDKPAEVKFWQATNPAARDFRLENIGPAYTSAILSDQGGGLYTAKVEKPEKGWTAGFIELTYPTAGKFPLKVTTGVKVMPDVYPYPPYKPTGK